MKLLYMSQDYWEDNFRIPGEGLWRVSPITEADDSDDDGDDEDGDVQRLVGACVCC